MMGAGKGKKNTSAAAKKRKRGGYAQPTKSMEQRSASTSQKSWLDEKPVVDSVPEPTTRAMSSLCQCPCCGEEEDYEYTIRDEYLLERLIRIEALDDSLWFLHQNPQLVNDRSIYYLEDQMETTYCPLTANGPATQFNRCARAKALLDRILQKSIEEQISATECIGYFRETLMRIGTAKGACNEDAPEPSKKKEQRSDQKRSRTDERRS